MSIVLDNAATTGTLVISGPSSGAANFNVPATDAVAVKSNLVWDIVSAKFVLEATPDAVTVPTNISAFNNDSGYQTAANVAAATAGFQTATDVANAVAPKANTADLKTVAFTGSYTDLINTPATPTPASIGAVAVADVGVANGVASLGSDGKVPSAQLPAYVDQIVEVANFAALPVTGTSGVIYITLDTNKEYRWGGTVYVELVSSPGSTDAVPEGSVNLYFTTARATAAAPVQSVAGKTGVVTLVAADVSGLATVATSGDYNDLTNKPVIPTVVSAFTNDAGYQTAAQVTTAIAGKANTTDLAPVAFSGAYADLSGKPTIPTVPTNVSAFTNDAGYLTAVPVASTTVVGGVKQGAGVLIAGDGTLSVSGSVVDPVTSTNTTSTAVATVNTTDATDTLALEIVMTDNSSVMFTADVVVKNGNGTAGGGYTLQGVVRRAAGVATVSLIGGALKSIVAEDVVAWDANAIQNTTSGNLEIRVQGAVANNLMWFVSTRITRIG